MLDPPLPSGVLTLEENRTNIRLQCVVDGMDFPPVTRLSFGREYVAIVIKCVMVLYGMEEGGGGGRREGGGGGEMEEGGALRGIKEGGGRWEKWRGGGMRRGGRRGKEGEGLEGRKEGKEGRQEGGGGKVFPGLLHTLG